MPEFHFRYSDNDRKEIKMSTVVEAESTEMLQIATVRFHYDGCR
jgi:hypothetical protein